MWLLIDHIGVYVKDEENVTPWPNEAKLFDNVFEAADYSAFWSIWNGFEPFHFKTAWVSQQKPPVLRFNKPPN